MVDKLLERYSVTSAGNALGGLIITKIDEQVNMNQLFCCCPSISDFLELMSRKLGYSTNKAIETAIKDYIVNYSGVCMRSIGTATLTVPMPLTLPNPFITVDKDYGLDINGILSFSDNDVTNNLFSVFSMSRLLGIDEPKDVNDKETPIGVDQLFNDIVSWLSCNNIPGSPSSVIKIDGNAFHNEITTTSTGTVYFNATDDEITTILVKVNENLFKLNKDNMAYMQSKQIAMPRYFELVWSIISTGLVEYMSINFVSSVNAGFGVQGLSLYTYTGLSQYKCDGSTDLTKVVFGDEYVQRVNVTVELKIPLPAPFTLPESIRYLKVTENIRVPSSKYTFTGRDINGKSKTFNIDINFPTINFDFWDGIDGFGVQVNKIALDMYANIEKILINVGYIVDAIEEVLLGIYNKIMEMVSTIITGMSGIIDRIFESFELMYMTILIRVQRQIVWSALEKSYPAFVGLHKVLDTVEIVKSQVDNALIKIEVVKEKIRFVTDYTRVVTFINDKISKVNNVKNKMLTKGKELIDFGVIIIQMGLDKLNASLQKMVDGIVNKLKNNMDSLVSNIKQKTVSLTDAMNERANKSRDRVEAQSRARLKLQGYNDGPELDDKVNRAMKQLDISGVFINITRTTREKSDKIRRDVNNNLTDLESKIIGSVENKFKTVKFKNLPTKVLNIQKNFMEPFLKCPIPLTISTMYDEITEELTQTGIDTISDTIVDQIDGEVISSVTTEVDTVDTIVDDTVDELTTLVVDIVITDKVIICVDGGCNCACGETSTIINMFTYKMEFPL